VQFLSPTDADLFVQGVAPSAPVFYECISYVSVIVGCQSDSPLLSLPDTSTYGLHTLTARATDAAGRTGTGTATYFVFDLTPPTITVRAPANGATYQVGQQVVVDWSCADPGGSGIAACLGSLPNGFRLDTSRPGTFTFTAGGLDNSFHSSSITVTYTVVGASQSISFAPIGDHTYGDSPLTLSATGGASGNPVTFTASGECAVSGTTLTITAAGNCTVTALQAGALGFLAAADVTQSFTIAKAPQAISFTPLSRRLYGDAPFSVSSTGGGSSNPVGFTTDGVCTLSGSTVTITDIGSCTVTAHQDGGQDYLPAPDVAQTFAIDPPPGCDQAGQVHGNEHFAYGSSDVFIQSHGTCAPSLQQAAVRVTLGGQQVLIDADQGAVTSVTFTHPGDAVIIGSWNGAKFRIDLHDGAKGGGLDTLRVRYGDLDTGMLTATHGDVLVTPS